jgi:hypothetical protein
MGTPAVKDGLFWIRQQHCLIAVAATFSLQSFPLDTRSRIMNRRLLSLLAVIALVAPVALFPVSAMAGQEPPIASASIAPLEETAGETAREALRSDHPFDQEELEELAALESENAELQEQQAGFFGPRIGTIIIVVVLLVVLL